MFIDKDLLNRTTHGDARGQAELYELLAEERIDKKAFLSYYVRRQVMNDLRRQRPRSPTSRKIIRQANEEQETIREEALNHTQAGHPDAAAVASSDLAYLRAKTEVQVSHEEHRFRMQPKNVYKTKSIVSYHWSPKKRREMQQRVNKIT